MAPDIPAHLICRLQKFDRAIATTDEYFVLLDGIGPYRASDPYVEKSAIAILIRSIPADLPQSRYLVAEYNRIVQKLVDLEKRRETGLVDKLAGELRYYLNSYHAGVCCMRLGMMDSVEVSDLAQRSVMRILLDELQSDHEILDFEEILAALDDEYLSLKAEKGFDRKMSSASCPECHSTACRCTAPEKIPE